MVFVCVHQTQAIRASEDSCLATFRQAVNISVLQPVHSSLSMWRVRFYLISVRAHGKSRTLAWLEILNCVSGMSALWWTGVSLAALGYPRQPWLGTGSTHTPWSNSVVHVSCGKRRVTLRGLRCFLQIQQMCLCLNAATLHQNLFFVQFLLSRSCQLHADHMWSPTADISFWGTAPLLRQVSWRSLQLSSSAAAP